MQNDQLAALFDRQAASYDQQWAAMQPIRDSLYFLLKRLFAELPSEARILCVGVGTGAELSFLAHTFPHWRFTALDPSAAMLDICRQRAINEGYAERCTFYQGYLEDLPGDQQFDAATCLLVSQFMVDQAQRRRFFQGIAQRLKPDGILVSADLAADTDSPAYRHLLALWLELMSGSVPDAQALERARTNYAQHVGILPVDQISALIESAGFALAVPFFQAGLMHAWASKCA